MRRPFRRSRLDSLHSWQQAARSLEARPGERSVSETTVDVPRPAQGWKSRRRRAPPRGRSVSPRSRGGKTSRLSIFKAVGTIGLVALETLLLFSVRLYHSPQVLSLSPCKRVTLDSVHGRTLDAPENGLAPVPLSNHGNRPRRKPAASARWRQPHGGLRLGCAKALGQYPAK